MRVVTPPKQEHVKHRHRNMRSLALWFVLIVIGAGFVWWLSATRAHTAEERREAQGDSSVVSVDNDHDQSTDLQNVLHTWMQQQGTGYHVVVQTLGDAPARASYKADTVTVPASTYKLFVAYAAYKQAEHGKLSLQQTLSSGKTVEQCIELAIVRSDNACAEAVGYAVGWEKVNQLAYGMGAKSTDINNYATGGGYNGEKQTTAADLALLLQQLHDGSLLNASHTDTLLGYMKRQVYRAGIPAGSGSSVVADKVGFLPGLTHDAAIVFGSKSDYVLVIMSDKTENWAYIKRLAAQVHEVLNR